MKSQSKILHDIDQELLAIKHTMSLISSEPSEMNATMLSRIKKLKLMMRR